MPVFVVTALALAVLAAAGAVLAGLQVRTAVGGLAAAVHRTGRVLRPLVSELTDELAVARTELDAIGSRRAK